MDRLPFQVAHHAVPAAQVAVVHGDVFWREGEGQPQVVRRRHRQVGHTVAQPIRRQIHADPENAPPVLKRPRAHDQAGLGATAGGGEHDVVEPDAPLRTLGQQFFHRDHVAACSCWVASAIGDDVGTAARPPHLRSHLGHDLGQRPVAGPNHGRPQQPIEQQVALHPGWLFPS